MHLTTNVQRALPILFHPPKHAPQNDKMHVMLLYFNHDAKLSLIIPITLPQSFGFSPGPKSKKYSRTYTQTHQYHSYYYSYSHHHPSFFIPISHRFCKPYSKARGACMYISSDRQTCNLHFPQFPFPFLFPHPLPCPSILLFSFVPKATL